MKNWTLDDWIDNWRRTVQPLNLCGPAQTRFCAGWAKDYYGLVNRNTRFTPLTPEELDRMKEFGDWRGPVEEAPMPVNESLGWKVDEIVSSMPKRMMKIACLHYLHMRRYEQVSRVLIVPIKVVETEVISIRMKIKVGVGI